MHYCNMHLINIIILIEIRHWTCNDINLQFSCAWEALRKEGSCKNRHIRILHKLKHKELWSKFCCTLLLLRNQIMCHNLLLLPIHYLSCDTSHHTARHGLGLVQSVNNNYNQVTNTKVSHICDILKAD